MSTSRPASKLLYRAIRLIKGLGHGSIFVLLALPLVTFSSCSGVFAQASGYRALTGVHFPGSTFQQDQPVDFGPDWWVAVIMLVAVAGVVFACWGGFKGATAGLGVALLGLGALVAAVMFFSAVQTSAGAGSGALWISVVFVCSIFLDLLWIAWRSWHEVWRKRKAQWPDRGDWFAAGLVATFFLVQVGGLLSVLVILLLSHPSVV